MPMVVTKADLGIGNARLMTAAITMNQLVAPAVGAALFAAGTAWPFVVESVCVPLAALLISRMRLPVRTRAVEKPRVAADIAECFRWTWGHPVVRTLTLTVVTFKVTYGAAWSVLVVYATEVLDMDSIGFGLLTTAGGWEAWSARRATTGSSGTRAWPRSCGSGSSSRPSCLGRTTTGRVALVIMFVFGARLRLGDDVAHGPDARGAHRAAGPGGQPLLARRLRRHRGAHADEAALAA